MNDQQIIEHALTAAARAENAKNHLLQAGKATEDGARFLRERAREALQDVVREAQAALDAMNEA